uniref:PD-(D/E)XK endonuclease-like domain-containing protein n=1 Tax=Thermus caliditerrae TaxID=1330700 RepID=A0A7C5VJP3_9DEIN
MEVVARRGNLGVGLEGTRAFLLEGSRVVKELVGVSQVLEVVARPRVVQWAVDLALDLVAQGASPEEARQAHAAVKRKASLTGQNLHRFVEAFLRGEAPSLPEGEEGKKAAAFAAWWREQRARVVALEEVVAHPAKGFYGRLDLLAEMGSRLILVDVKATSGFRPQGEIQLGGYALALEAWWGVRPEEGLLLRVKGEGVEARRVDLEAAREAFAAALTLYRFLEARRSTPQEVLR